MKKVFFAFAGALALVALVAHGSASAQNVKLKNATSWELTGRVQLQHLYNSDIAGDAGSTNNGFRMRRGRLQVAGKLTEFVETKFQIEVRDNSPRLKDAEGVLHFANDLYLRFGQYKVPVWREELRSSSKLLLVERSVVAEFLADYNLSARHIGVEFGRVSKNKLSFAVNFSNGSGEGGREDAGRSKSDYVNNGKMLSGRVNLPVGEMVQVGVSGVMNRVGNTIGTQDNSGSITAVAPDFGIYMDAGERSKVEIEGGFVFGSVDQEFLQAQKSRDFTLFDVTGRYTQKLAKVSEGLAGMDAFELAAGFSRTDVDATVTNVFRFGPAFYFGKQTRLQINGEIEKTKRSDSVFPDLPDLGDSVFQVRSQITFNF